MVCSILGKQKKQKKKKIAKVKNCLKNKIWQYKKQDPFLENNINQPLKFRSLVTKSIVSEGIF